MSCAKAGNNCGANGGHMGASSSPAIIIHFAVLCRTNHFAVICSTTQNKCRPPAVQALQRSCMFTRRQESAQQHMWFAEIRKRMGRNFLVVCLAELAEDESLHLQSWQKKYSHLPGTAKRYTDVRTAIDMMRHRHLHMQDCPLPTIKELNPGSSRKCA